MKGFAIFILILSTFGWITLEKLATGLPLEEESSEIQQKQPEISSSERLKRSFYSSSYGNYGGGGLYGGNYGNRRPYGGYGYNSYNSYGGGGGGGFYNPYGGGGGFYNPYGGGGGGFYG